MSIYLLLCVFRYSIRLCIKCHMFLAEQPGKLTTLKIVHKYIVFLCD